jgi:hypothetical protein
VPRLYNAIGSVGRRRSQVAIVGVLRNAAWTRLGSAGLNRIYRQEIRMIYCSAEYNKVK